VRRPRRCHRATHVPAAVSNTARWTRRCEGTSELVAHTSCTRAVRSRLEARRCAMHFQSRDAEVATALPERARPTRASPRTVALAATPLVRYNRRRGRPCPCRGRARAASAERPLAWPVRGSHDDRRRRRPAGGRRRCRARRSFRRWEDRAAALPCPRNDTRPAHPDRPLHPAQSLHRASSVLSPPAAGLLFPICRPVSK